VAPTLPSRSEAPNTAIDVGSKSESKLRILMCHIMSAELDIYMTKFCYIFYSNIGNQYTA
jgi:hypothetical protein